MIPLHQIEKMIPDLAGAAVLIIATSSFILSFFNLQAAAIEAGINPWLSWLWPVCIDALLIAGSLMILRSNLRNESPLIGWSVLLTFTVVSTAFNTIHSPAGLTAQAAHGIPPIALCVSIELLMLCIRSDLSGQPDQGGEHQCTDNMVTDQAPVQPVSTFDSPDTREMILTHFSEHPTSTHAAAARSLGISRSTVTRHMRALSAAGLIQQVGE